MPKLILNKIMTFLIISFILMGTFLAVNNYQVSATPLDLYQELSNQEQYLFGDITHQKIIGQTQTTRPVGNVAGYGSTGPIELGTWYQQQINIVNVVRNQMAQVVPWSIRSSNSWNFSSLTAIATDFEKNNPDLMVLAAINADFYDWHSTLDYPNSGWGNETVFGNNLRISNTRPSVAISNDNTSLQQLTYLKASETIRSNLPTLTIYDQFGNIIYNQYLDQFNQPLKAGQTGAYFGKYQIEYLYDEFGKTVPNQYGDPTIASRNYLAPVTPNQAKGYLVSVADDIILQANDNSYYGKGKISQITEESINVPSSGFAIYSDDPTVSALLKEDVVVRVQFEHVGSSSGANSIIGCHHVLIEDGVFAQYYDSEDYYTTRAPRTIIAQKADGTIGLITIDGRQLSKNMYGTNQEEFNAILEAYGYTDAMLLDGGGSTTMIVRNGDKFEVVNSPSDGNIRSISNGLLVVIPRSPFKIGQLTSTKTSFSIQLDNDTIDSTKIKDIRCTLNGVTKSFVNGLVTFDQLSPNSSYRYRIFYDTDQVTNCEAPIGGYASTAKTALTVSDVEVTYDDKYLYLTPVINDPDQSFVRYYCEVNDQTFTSNQVDKVIKVNRIFIVGDNLRYKLTIYYNTLDYQGEHFIEISDAYNFITGKNPPIDSPCVPPIDETPKGCFNNNSYILTVGGSLALGVMILINKKRD